MSFLFLECIGLSIFRISIPIIKLLITIPQETISYLSTLQIITWHNNWNNNNFSGMCSLRIAE